ncbi:MAG TPA: hypothetical protein VGW36_07525 [Pyrinomonadaceae bacterium]|nr:hypothetical protein [Pyrinomonadaceae bacterium]
MKNFGKGIGGALLSLAFVFGLFVATTGTAEAQYRNDDRYYGRDSKEERKARKRAWKQRRKQDHRQGDWRRNRNHDVYDNGRYGRNGGYGNNGGYGGYGNGGYDQAELNRGYQQGIETGSSDGQRGQSYDPQRSRHFKNAPTQAFREGFVRGYDQGYRQYAGNGNHRNRDSGWGNILGGILGRQ